MPFTINNFIAAVAALGLATSTLAAPTLTKRITPNTQSCTCTDYGIGLGSYSVTIGIPFNGGGRCNDVLNALNNAGDMRPSAWQCVDDQNGGTQLWFNALLNRGGDIDAALESMYPTIAGGFNCPDY